MAAVCPYCRRHCLLRPGKPGFCGGYKGGENEEVEANLYGVLSILEVETVSNIPLTSWSGRSQALAVATKGCMARCHHCTNIKYAHHPLPVLTGVETFSPEKVAQFAQARCLALAADFVEPVNIGTWLLDAFTAAKELNVPTILGTAGGFEVDFLERLLPVTSVVRLDIKGWTKESLRKQGFWFNGLRSVEFVFETALCARKHNAHLELTICVIPSVNDDPDDLKRMSARIIDVLGADTPVTLIGHWKGHENDRFPIASEQEMERIHDLLVHYGLTVQLARIV